MKDPEIFITDERKFNVLIVDDVPQNLQVLSNILYKKGIGVSIAPNGKQAVKIATLKQPDLILLDISMPEMDGYEVCEILKKNPVTEPIPIIFLTAKTEKENIVKGLELGAVDYVTKPFNAPELISRVKTHLELKFKTEQVMQMNQILEQKVEERTAQLNQANKDLTAANKELEKLDKAKNEFLLLINHELRTPLNGILGFAQILESSLEATEHANSIKLIHHSADRLVKISEMTLLITSLRADSYKLRKVSTKISDFIDDIIYYFEDKTEDKNLEILNICEDENLDFIADQNLLQKCLNIIIDNAIRHSPQNEKIYIYTTTENDSVIIEIADSGPGFPVEVLERSFLMFESNDTNKFTEGFGLGLATSKLIMDTMEGTISIDNQDSRGALVKLTLNIEQ